MGSEADAEQVVAAARRGDQGAWEQLLGSLYPRLRAYTARRLPPPYVEDAVSETMTRAVAGIDRFRWGPAGFDGWVFGIGRNVVADHYRSVSKDADRADRMVGPDLSELPGDAVDLGEDHAQVRRCFALLNDKEQELLGLRVIAGLSAEQVAAVLGKRPGAVRSAQSRALSRLRELMESDDA
ncbi:MAG: sigma-70 family RNA polymerase sigma factor [Acidimicrobiales bacterium]|jgi:RNA polymerase sigma-70 factor (ECF subfamily)